MTDGKISRIQAPFLLRRKMKEDAGGIKQKALRLLWNTAALLLSSFILCVVLLLFAFGHYMWSIYLGYLKTTEILVLNWIPILLLQILLYALFNRQWAAFLLTGAVTFAMSLGNYYKLIIRNDPFTAEDISSIRAALSVMKGYKLSIDWRVLLALVVILLGTTILGLLARARIERPLRLVLAVLALTSCIPLWNSIYSSKDRYYENAYQNETWVTYDERDRFLATGFFYPFLYSFTQSTNLPPENYNELETQELYARYKNGNDQITDILNEEDNVNLMVIQLESFCDLSDMGLDGIRADVYDPLHRLQRESISGTMIPSVIGGGTINTERCVLSGNYRLQDYYKPAFSYVRWLNRQGYISMASHPNEGSFYSRATVNEYLGFHDFYDLNNYFQGITGGNWRCDSTYLPEIFRMFREKAEEEQPVFSFNVSLQGHSPYNMEGFDEGDDYWSGESVSDSTRYVLNNYLSMISETQTILCRELEKLRTFAEPVIVTIYGDHKPWFGDAAYAELGLNISMETEEGMINYLGTPYCIWANDAAKKLTQNEFVGDGPLISPGYLMNILFHELGWKGPAFLQFTDDLMIHLPVICNKGAYIENSKYVKNLSEQGEALLKQYQDLQFYLRYRPEE